MIKPLPLAGGVGVVNNQNMLPDLIAPSLNPSPKGEGDYNPLPFRGVDRKVEVKHAPSMF